MPPKERQTPRRRRSKRRGALHQQAAAAPAGKPATAAPAPVAKASPQSKATAPVPAAMIGQHKIVLAELRRVGIIIGVLLIALVVLALLLR